MADTLDQFEAKLNRLLEELPDVLLKKMLTIALDAKAALQKRIIDTGKNAVGEAFEDYSISYKKFKSRKGRYRGHVDFEFTGNMWRGFGLVESGVEGGLVSISYGGTNADVEEKLENIEDNSKYSGFLELSEDEIDDLEDTWDAIVEREVNKFLS